MDEFGKSKRVAICRGPECSKRNSARLVAVLEQEIAAQGLQDRVSTRPGACNKLCERGPSMVVHPDRIWYERPTPDAVRRIVRQHLAGGEPVEEWAAHDRVEESEQSRVRLSDDFLSRLGL